VFSTPMKNNSWGKKSVLEKISENQKTSSGNK